MPAGFVDFLNNLDQCTIAFCLLKPVQGRLGIAWPLIVLQAGDLIGAGLNRDGDQGYLAAIRAVIEGRKLLFIDKVRGEKVGANK